MVLYSLSSYGTMGCIVISPVTSSTELVLQIFIILSHNQLFCLLIYRGYTRLSQWLATLQDIVQIAHIPVYPQYPLYAASPLWFFPQMSSVTLGTLLFWFHRNLRVRDATKIRVQLCIAIGCMLIVFVVGIDRTEVFGVCVAMSCLIQYFTMAAIMWMAAEATLMFRKLVIVFTQFTKRYFVILSLICWRKLALSRVV